MTMGNWHYRRDANRLLFFHALQPKNGKIPIAIRIKQTKTFEIYVKRNVSENLTDDYYFFDCIFFGDYTDVQYNFG